jgi:hypothetical protein
MSTSAMIRFMVTRWSVFDPKVQERIISRAGDIALGQARVDLLQRYFEVHLERARRFV